MASLWGKAVSLEVKDSFRAVAMEAHGATVCINFEKILFSNSNGVHCVRALKYQTSCVLLIGKN